MSSKKETYYTVERLDTETNNWYQIKKFKKDYYGAIKYCTEIKELGSYRIIMYKYNPVLDTYKEEDVKHIKR